MSKTSSNKKPPRLDFFPSYRYGQAAIPRAQQGTKTGSVLVMNTDRYHTAGTTVVGLKNGNEGNETISAGRFTAVLSNGWDCGAGSVLQVGNNDVYEPFRGIAYLDVIARERPINKHVTAAESKLGTLGHSVKMDVWRGMGFASFPRLDQGVNLGLVVYIDDISASPMAIKVRGKKNGVVTTENVKPSSRSNIVVASGWDSGPGATISINGKLFAGFRGLVACAVLFPFV